MSVPTVVIALLAIAALADALALGASVWFLGRVLNTHALLSQLTKLEEAGNRTRAAKLCTAGNKALVCLYSRYLFSLQIPRKTVGGASDGFRLAAPSIDFDEIVRQKADEGRRRFERRAHISGAFGIGGGIIAALASVVFFPLYGQWPWEAEQVNDIMKVAIGLGAIGLLLGLFCTGHWSKTLEALRLIERTIVPWLVPVEEMNEDKRGAVKYAPPGP